jgi:flagellar biosynthesis protein FlhF
MKIKRFEAASMSEALRMIKREFGEDAVILSAKNMKKSSRLFGAGKCGKVVVTAAVDALLANPEDADGTKQGSSRLADGQSDIISNMRRQQRAAPIAPITRTGQQKLRDKFMQFRPQAGNFPQESAVSCSNLQNHLIEQGMTNALAAELTHKVLGLLPSGNARESEIRTALAQVVAVKGLVAPMRLFGRSRDRIKVMVGPHGSGKTTAAAKLAAQAILQKKQKPAVLTLDNQRIAGTVELERYARIMGFELERADNPEQVQDALRHLKAADVIIVDTPGINPDDREHRDHLAGLLELLPDARVHLLLSAQCTQRVWIKMTEFFRIFELDSFVFTHLGWVEQFGHLFSFLLSNELPVAFLSSSGPVHEGMLTATGEELVSLLWPPTDNQKLNVHASCIDQQTDTEDPLTMVERIAARPNIHAAHYQYAAKRY